MCVPHACSPSVITDVVEDKCASTERACLKMLHMAASF